MSSMKYNAAPNNGMHPTVNSGASMRETRP